jgi:hypothetical protein
MRSTTSPPKPPLPALIVAGYGSALGSLFPVMTVIAVADRLTAPIQRAVDRIYAVRSNMTGVARWSSARVAK